MRIAEFGATDGTRMKHGLNRQRRGGRRWGKLVESSALTPALRAATASTRRGRRMGTGVMPLQAVGDVLGKLEGSSALTPALSPRRGRNGCRGRIVRRHRRAFSAAVSRFSTRPAATLGARTVEKGSRSKAMACRLER